MTGNTQRTALAAALASAVAVAPVAAFAENPQPLNTSFNPLGSLNEDGDSPFSVKIFADYAANSNRDLPAIEADRDQVVAISYDAIKTDNMTLGASLYRVTDEGDTGLSLFHKWQATDSMGIRTNYLKSLDGDPNDSVRVGFEYTDTWQGRRNIGLRLFLGAEQKKDHRLHSLGFAAEVGVDLPIR